MTPSPQQTLWEECNKILNHDTHRRTLSKSDQEIGLQAAAMLYAAKMFGYNTAQEMEVDIRGLVVKNKPEYHGTVHRHYEQEVAK